MNSSSLKLALAAVLAIGSAPALAAPAPAPAPSRGPGAAPWPPQPMTAGGKYVMHDGAAIFHNVCANCHMQDGKGASGSGIYPALATNPKLGAAAYPIMVVVNGQKGMPAFGELLDDDQVAAVVGYIRTNLGNHFADPVNAAEVKAMR